MMKRISGLWAFWLVALVAGCAALPQETGRQAQRIPVGDGPEDIVLDDFGFEHRFLISCDDRREPLGEFAEIVQYYPESGVMDTMKRMEEPKGHIFHPHGISLQQVGPRLYLYVVNHQSEKTSEGQVISLYQVSGDELYWIRDYASPLFTSPNEVAALPDGSFYVSNDRANREKRTEAYFKSKKSTIVHCDKDGNCKVAARKVAYGNGIAYRDGYVYQSATRGNCVYAYEIAGDSLVNRQVIAEVTGPDNLRWDGDDLLVTCHLRPLAFVGHSKDASKLSPTTVYRIGTEPGEPELVYADAGDEISGGATAIRLSGYLYIVQVFDPFLLKVNLNK